MKQKDEPVVANFKPPKRFRIPRSVLGIALGTIVVIAIIVGLSIYLNHRHNLEIANHGVCSSGVGLQLVNESANDLTVSTAYKLSPIALHITALKNYQKDVNCVYVVTSYYANDYALSGATFMYADAKSSLATFNKLYTGSNVDSNLTSKESVQTLRNNIAKLKSGPTIHNLFGL